MPHSKRMDTKMTEQTARAEDAAAPQQDASTAPEQAGGDPATLAAELKDRLLRTLAEMENLRKRTAREVTDARVYGVTSLARDLLGVADNMRRALEAVTPAMRASAEPGVKAFIEGVELTERELEKALEKNGVQQFNPRGEKFDPNFHQAMFGMPRCRPAASSRSCSRATRSASACCGQLWSGCQKAARSRPPGHRRRTTTPPLQTAILKPPLVT
jgi:molecular chaperone GrpE